MPFDPTVPFSPTPERIVKINTSIGDPLDQFWDTINRHTQGQPPDQCTVKIVLTGNRPIVTQGIPTLSGLKIFGMGAFQKGGIPYFQLQDNATQDLFIVPDEWHDTPGGTGSVWYNHGFQVYNILLDGNRENQVEPLNIMTNMRGGFNMFLDKVFFRNAKGAGFVNLGNALNVYGRGCDFAACERGAIHVQSTAYNNGDFKFSEGQIDNCGEYPVKIHHLSHGSPFHSAAQYTLTDYKFETQDDNRTIGILDTKAFIQILNVSDMETCTVNLERLKASTWLDDDGNDGDQVAVDSFIEVRHPFPALPPAVLARSITARGRQIADMYRNHTTGYVFHNEPMMPMNSKAIWDKKFGLANVEVIDPDPPVVPTDPVLPETLIIQPADEDGIATGVSEIYTKV